MKKIHLDTRRFFAPLACALLVCSPLALRAQAPAASGTSLIPNSDFSLDENGDGTPDGWKCGDGITWENEFGKHFLRLTSQRPGQMLMAYREIRIPDGVKAAELTIRYRSSGVKKGDKPWFDARTIIHFMDGARQQVKPDAGTIVFKPDVAEWTEAAKQFAIPEGAKIIQLMPALFQVAAGRIDFAEIRIVGIDPSALNAK